ncbi:hypothetical protein F5Y16DRAFT_49578 [Xylariaceae sp. FL0255]|nr:hypothetical protein F5Y16DRAFT_49578 [Xylariaceae sp. FL0255]
MSVFSIIRRGRAQAKDQKSKQAEQQKEEAVKLPYKHVVTHAASDALATAPSSWKHDDRTKIIEQNKRRSAMIASGMSSHGLPRVGSSVSFASHPSVYSSPIPPMPKNYSYTSIPTSWREKIASTPDSVEGSDYFRSHKGKGREVVRFVTGSASPMLSSGRSSALSNREISECVELGNISGSDDERAMRGTSKAASSKSVPNNIDAKTYRNPVPNRSENIHRLHPAQSHARRVSEATGQSDRHYPPPAKSTYFSAPRPTVRHRRVNTDPSAPPVPLLPGQYIARGLDASSSTSSVVSIGMAVSTPPSSVNSEPVAAAKEYNQAPVFELAQPPKTKSRRPSFSFGGSRRNSSDTIVPASTEQPISDPLAARPSNGRRRLSKLRTAESVDTPQPTESIISFEPFTTPSLLDTETIDSEIQPEERKRRPSWSNWGSSSSPAIAEHPRRRLSKGPPEPKDPATKTHRWSS